MRHADIKDTAGRISVPIVGIMILFLFVACQTTYYAVWEQLGKEKRHLLKDQVEKARSDQEEASEQFKDVLTRIKEMYGFDGGGLEEFYNKLKSDYEEEINTLKTQINNIKSFSDFSLGSYIGQIAIYRFLA